MKKLKKNKTTCLMLLIAIMLLTVAGCTQTKGTREFIGITSERIEDKGGSGNKISAFQNTTIKMDSFDVNGDVDISGKIGTTDGDVPFHFIGDLYISEKQNHGIEAYVGQIVDNENNFTVNYFEIKNDTNYDLLKYSEEHLNTRVVCFDLERNGVNYYFELDMDALGTSFNAEHITEMAPSEIDFYENYVNEEKSVAPCIIPYDSEENKMVKTKSGNTHSYSATGGRWYHKLVVDSWFGEETVYEYYAEPKIEGEIVDVWTASSWEWTSQLIFDGYVEKNGVRIDTIDNVFRIPGGMDEDSGNGIEFQLHVGENTICTLRTYSEMYDMNRVKNSHPTQAEQALVSDVNENGDIIYRKFADAVSLEKEGQSVSFLGYVSTIDSADVSNQETECTVRWSYHMYYRNKPLIDGFVTLEKTISYIVNMK